MAITDAGFWILAGTSFATAIVSGIVGMAGGAALLSVMLLLLDPLEAIALHGVVQLFSNGSRTWIQRAHVRARIVVPFCVLLLPAAYVGFLLAERLPPHGLKAVIGGFILLATWLPSVSRLPGGAWLPERTRFFLLGGVSGFLQTTVGAVGPLLAPFFLRSGLDRFALIGTKAACQLSGHAAKLVVFSAVGFAFGKHLTLLGMLAILALLGTAAGSRLLKRVDERTFVWLYKTVLTAVALRLVVSPLV